MQHEIRARKNARVSVNVLGRYLVASASARERMIAGQAFPATFITARYEQAAEPIRQFLLSGGTATVHLDNAIRRLSATSGDAEWMATNRAICIDVLQRMPGLASKLELGDDRGPPKRPGVITLAGLPISVRPELILSKRGKQGIQLGAVKLVIAKSDPLDDGAGRYIAQVLRLYMEAEYPQFLVNPALCQVADPFSGTVWVAPRAYKRATRDIEAACREILLRWPVARD